MQSQWTDWLRELAAAGQGGKDMVLTPITRGKAYSHTLSIEADVSGDAWTADLRLSPDADGATLAIFTVTVGAYADGATPVTISLTSGQAALAGAGDDDNDGLAEAVFSLFHTPSGSTQYRAAACSIAVTE